jgi:hypothetical protein
MKYYLIAWTAKNPDGEDFSGNASMEWDGGFPSDDTIIHNLQEANEKLKKLSITLQDKLEFDSREELERYGSS